MQPLRNLKKKLLCKEPNEDSTPTPANCPPLPTPSTVHSRVPPSSHQSAQSTTPPLYKPGKSRETEKRRFIAGFLAKMLSLSGAPARRLISPPPPPLLPLPSFHRDQDFFRSFFFFKDEGNDMLACAVYFCFRLLARRSSLRAQEMKVLPPTNRFFLDFLFHFRLWSSPLFLRP